MRRAVLFQVLCGLLLTPGFGVQDPPGGPPVALAVKVEGQQNPNYVAGKLAYLHIQAVDRFGMPLPVNGDGVVVRTTDPRNRLNGLEVGFVNGKIVLKLQWFTPSKGHTIEVASKSGLKGGLTGIRVDPLPKGTKLGIVGPKPWARYLWSGGMFRLRVKATDENDDPVEHVEISLKLSKGARAFPHGYYTEDSTGIASGVIFPPEFICPGDEGGGGTVNGDAPLKLQAFIDVNGNGDIDNGEPIVEPPPADLVSSCPQVLLPAGLELLRILEEGGTLSRPPPDDVIVVGVVSAGSGGGKGKALGKNKPVTLTDRELAKIRAARRFLEDEVIGFVNSGKWNGMFSQVRKRVEHLAKLLKDVAPAEPVVQRLECSAKLLQGNPDVRRLKLSIQETGRRIEVPVGFNAPVDVQNVGSGNKVIAPDAFTDCFRPALSEAEAAGPGTVQISDADPTQLQYECTGVGDVQLAVTMAYRPLTAIIIDAADRTGAKRSAVPATQVFDGGEGIAAMTFELSGAFVIVQFPPDLFFVARTPKTNVFARTDTLMIARWEHAYESKQADTIAKTLDPLARQMRQASLQLDEAIRRGNDQAAQQFRSRLGTIAGQIGTPLADWLGVDWNVRENFLDREDQRFFVELVRLRGTVFGLTREATVQPDQEPNPITITLRRRGEDFESRALILTSDEVDDKYVKTSVPGKGETGSAADNDPEDRTYLARIGGTVTAKHDPLKLEKVAKVCEKVKTIPLKIFILRDPATGDPVVPEAEVRAHVQAANEVFAQCCIKFDADIQVVDPPAGVGLADGLQVQPRALATNPNSPPVRSPTPEEQAQEDFALFEALGTEDTNDIVVFYVNRILPKNQVAGYAGLDYPEAQFFGTGSTAEKKRVNNVLVAARVGKYTFSHEIGHILLNISTYHLKNSNLPSYNLMAIRTKFQDRVTDSKRLTGEQCDIIEKNASRFAR
jgi:hypothetical protein